MCKKDLIFLFKACEIYFLSVYLSICAVGAAREAALDETH